MYTPVIPSLLRLFDFFTLAFSALLPKINPLGSTILFLDIP